MLRSLKYNVPYVPLFTPLTQAILGLLLCVFTSLPVFASSAASSPALAEWKALAERERTYGESVKALQDCQWILSQKDSVEKKAASSLLNDAKKALAARLQNMTCTAQQRDTLKQKLADLRGQKFNVASSLTLYSDLGDNYPEWLLDANFSKSLERERSKFCTDMVSEGFDADDLHDNSLWFAMLLKEGFTCVSKNFKALSWHQGHNADIQKLFEQIQSAKIEPSGDLHGLQIALVPHFSYEYADFQSRFGSAERTVFHDNREVLLYRQLVAELTKRGAIARVLNRTTTANLNDQIAQTWQGLQEMKASLLQNGQTPHILILSRSAGSQVVEGLLRAHSSKLSGELNGVRGWLNLGGTAHGSVISDYDTQLDRYYTSVYLGQLSFYPLLQFIKNARNFMFQSADVNNIKSLSQLNATTVYDPKEKSRTLPILNVTMLVDYLEDRTKSEDPVVACQMLDGPTEGSSRIGDSVSDSTRSGRVFVNRDHLIFRELNAEQSLHMYLSAIRAYLGSGLEN